MTPSQLFIPQSDPPRPPWEILPTMYDLPSENPEDPGLPDEYHDLQPQLLSRTFRLKAYPPDRIFTGTDLNLYYDIRHHQWYKRPDWFVALGVPRLYDEQDLRLSYVVWQEGVNPFVVIEFLSPGSEKEDLGPYAEGDRPRSDTDQSNGSAQSDGAKPPSKWQVYEQILRVPYYIVFSRYTDRLRLFSLSAGRYQEQDLTDSKLWIPELEVGLGLWQGTYEGIDRLWLRWYDETGAWIPTDTEQAEYQAEQERQRADRLADYLRNQGIDPDQI
jgi:Uma2 family endonuclease